jgi:tetratricopeptide (TPR) repeat protein
MAFNRRTVFLTVFTAAFLVIFGAGGALGAVAVGQAAAPFSLPDIDGRVQKVEQNQDLRLAVLFFFDAVSPSSQEGLLMLDQLGKQYGTKLLTIWGITRSPQSEVSTFIKKTKIGFPILMDSGEVSRQYNAQIVLPIVCILGPDFKVIDYYQGGGKGAEAMLVSLAQSQLHRNQPVLAEALGEAVAKKNPKNLEAKAVQGYAALKQGLPDKAEKLFDQIAGGQGNGDIIAKEGQAAVMAYQGQTDKALALAEEVTHKAPNRGLAQKLKGDLLAAKGNMKAAAAAYQKAVQQPEADTYQKAEAHNQLGRLYAQQGNYAGARAQFDRAVDLDPYYLEPTSNKGVTYEKEGQWSKALEEYRKAVNLNQADTVATVLAQKAEKMLALQKDAAGKARIDRLVADLAKRYKDQKSLISKEPQDEWTSRPMIMTLLDVQESGALTSRDGLAIVLSARLGDLLNDSGRVQVVERALIDQLLSELNLGSSELADPNTALKLGKLLAAKLIGTGSLIYLPDSTLLNLRFIDTETSAVAKTITLRLPANVNLEREMHNLNRTILKTVMEKYPLQGFVVKVDGDKAILNLGSSQGVSSGSSFEVIEEGQPVTYKGKVLRSSSKSMGKMEVVQVEPDYCIARIVEKQRPLAGDDKVKEILPENLMQGESRAK